MKLKLTLARPTGAADLSVTADATATVGDIAERLAGADPTRQQTGHQALRRAVEQHSGAGLGLRVWDVAAPSQGGRILDAGVGIADAGMRSGSRVELVAGQFEQPGERAEAAAVLRIVAGPGAGREIPLPAGSTVIGRHQSVDLQISDPLVSGRHARISVTDVVEITDLNSANGIVISGDVVPHATLRATDVVVLGDTAISVVPLRAASGAAGPVVEHIRSPRVIPRYPGEKFPAPKPPEIPQPQRLPLVTMMAPLIVGAVMYMLTRQVLAVVMMGLTPILLIGSFVDQGFAGRRLLKQQKKRFAESMLQLQETLNREQIEERRVRRLEAPSTTVAIQAIETAGPLLWCRRPEHPEFGWLTLGCGRARSRNALDIPQTNETFPEYWDQLVQMRAAFAEIAEVPIVGELRAAGGVGVAGPKGIAGGVARAVVCQGLALHSPAELAVTAIVSPASRADWEWLKWTPHSSSAHSPVAADHLVDGPASAAALLAALEALVQARTDKPPTLRGPIGVGPERSDDKGPQVPTVLLVVSDDAPVDRGRLTRLAEQGADAGIHVLWTAADVTRLPAACRTFVSLDHTAAGAVVGQVRLGERVHPVAVETLDVARAEHLARLLSPVVDISIPEDDDSDLPSNAPYPALAGKEILDSPASLVERWRENNSLVVRDGSPPVRRKKDGDLRALVGSTGTAPFFLDLRREGPHALVGGTTGAGKSEFLQAWVLGMAAGHSPDRLTFLFVDYKGGSAFADCIELPHAVGLVTDLSPHLVRRALTSLKAELRYREHLLNRKKAKDLISLERTGDPECPPSLVIIVDEFAALKQEVPEFVDGVIDVGQRGRSLGLHLILATQRPAGVISGSLRANTNLRIALRMADRDDSVDILEDPMAAFFDPGIPGRGAAKTGPGRIQPFQTGYAGGWTTDETPRPRIEIEEMNFGVGASWEMPEAEAVAVADPGPTDITRIVGTIRSAAASAQVPQPRKPWLPELAPIYNIDVLSRQTSRRSDERIALGVVDVPAEQLQRTVFYAPDTDGNMALFGTGGSGKSAALRTLAVAAARSGLVHVYGMDFGSSGLRMLEELPHVGAIIDGDDEERIGRLLRLLRDVVNDRAARYGAINAGSIGEFRERGGVADEPRYLLLVDGIGAFRDKYEITPWFTTFSQIAADGRGVGVHIVMTGDRANALPNSIASTVQRRIVLRLAGEDDYALLGVPKDILNPTSPPGRGVLGGEELQLAIVGDSPNVALQGRAIGALSASMRSLGGRPPVPIQRLAEQIWLPDLPVGQADAPVIGVEDLSLGPATIGVRGAFMLSGPPGSGRTTALATISAALRRAAPGLPQVFLTARRSGLSQRPYWYRRAEGGDAVAELVPELESEIAAGKRFAVLLEHVTEFTGTPAEYALEPFIKAAVREDCFVVGEAESSTWSQAYTLAQPFKAGRRGLLLAPGELDGDSLLGTSLGRIRRADFPPGRGFLIEAGKARKLQVAEEGA